MICCSSTRIHPFVRILQRKDRTSSLSLSLVSFFLRRWNKFFISGCYKSSNPSFFCADRILPGAKPRGASSRALRRRKISDVLRVSSYTIYALLSGVNNNQPSLSCASLLSLAVPLGTKPHLADISLAPFRAVRPALSSITSGRFVSVTSALRYRPTDSSLFRVQIFLLTRPAFLPDAPVGALAANARAGLST